MKLTITARHFHLTPAIEEFVTKKLAGMEVMTNGEAKVHVILSVDKYLHTAEFVLQAKHMMKEAVATSKDLYDAINKSVKKLDRELVTFHKKEQEKGIRMSRKLKMKGLRP